MQLTFLIYIWVENVIRHIVLIKYEVFVIFLLVISDFKIVAFMNIFYFEIFRFFIWTHIFYFLPYIYFTKINTFLENRIISQNLDSDFFGF